MKVKIANYLVLSVSNFIQSYDQTKNPMDGLLVQKISVNSLNKLVRIKKVFDLEKANVEEVQNEIIRKVSPETGIVDETHAEYFSVNKDINELLMLGSEIEFTPIERSDINKIEMVFKFPELASLIIDILVGEYKYEEDPGVILLNKIIDSTIEVKEIAE